TREARRVGPAGIGSLLLALTTVGGGCGGPRPFDPARMNPDVAMARGVKAVQVIASSRRWRDPASVPRYVRDDVGRGAARERRVASRVPARQIVVVAAGE